jgi:hypothetical protein
LDQVKGIASRLYPDAILVCDRGAMSSALYLPEWMPKAEQAARQLRATTTGTRGTHHVLYVVLLKDTRRVGRWGLYVGETSVDPDLRFDQHKTGYKASRYVNRFGVRLLPELFEHFNPLRRWEAVELEPALAEAFRHAGVPWVEGGH